MSKSLIITHKVASCTLNRVHFTHTIFLKIEVDRMASRSYFSAITPVSCFLLHSPLLLPEKPVDQEPNYGEEYNDKTHVDSGIRAGTVTETCR